MESPLKAVADVRVPPLPLSVAGRGEELAAVLEAVTDGIAIVSTGLDCLLHADIYEERVQRGKEREVKGESAAVQCVRGRKRAVHN